MHRTPNEWAKVSAYSVTSGSQAQAENVLRMALDDIGEMQRALQMAAEALYNPFEPDNQSKAYHRVRKALGIQKAER